MSFHQSQMTRQVIYLPTDVKPTRRILKSKRDLVQLEEGSSDIYMSTKFDEYLHRPQELKDMTYPDFFKWWRKSSSDEHKKGETQSAEGNLPCLRSRNTDDFKQFIATKRIKTNAIDQLSLALSSIANEMPNNGEHVMILFEVCEI